MAERKWEYSHTLAARDTLDGDMNAQDRAGWEVVSVLPSKHKDHVVMVRRRPYEVPEEDRGNW